MMRILIFPLLQFGLQLPQFSLFNTQRVQVLLVSHPRAILLNRSTTPAPGTNHISWSLSPPERDHWTEFRACGHSVSRPSSAHLVTVQFPGLWILHGLVGQVPLLSALPGCHYDYSLQPGPRWPHNSNICRSRR